MALESSNISDLKSKLGGGGLMETLKGLRGLVVWKTGLLLNTGKADFKVSNDGSEMAMWVFCIMSPKDEIFRVQSFIFFQIMKSQFSLIINGQGKTYSGFFKS